MYGRQTHKIKEFDMAVKTSRIDIRLLPGDKSTIEAAASIKRVSVSTYILSAAIEAAKTDIEREERITLNDTSRDALLHLLDNPPEPSEALKKLFQ